MKKLLQISIALIAFAALSAFGAVAPHDALLGASLFCLGEIATVGDLAEVIRKQGEAWGEFMKTNEARLAALEKGHSTAEFDVKLGKINDDMADMRKQVVEYQKSLTRPGAASGDADTEQKAAHRKAFDKFLRSGDATDLKAMNTYSDPDGGVLVLDEMDSVIDRVVPTISAMYRLANVITIGTQKYTKLVKKTGMAMRRVGNGATGGETTEPTYAEIAIEAFTAEVEPWVHNETLQDAFIDLETDLANEAAIAFAEGAGAEFITGDGVAKARGIAAYNMVANASYAWGSIGYIASGKSAAFASVAPADEIVSLQHALRAQYRPGAVWMTSDTTLGIMRQMKDGSGSYYLWNPDPLGGFGGRFLGSPVEVDDNFAALGAGSLSLAYLNPKRGYTIVDRAGTTLIRDAITAKGTTKFNFRRRFGGGIVNFEAIKLMKFATS